MNRQLRFEIRETSQIGEARRTAADLVRRLGFDEVEAGKVAIAMIETGTNLLKHAGGGELLLQALGRSGGAGIELVAVDRGPGMADVAKASRDGFSTAGSLGTGLGSLSRLSPDFDIYSTAGKGTVIRLAIWATKDGRMAAMQGLQIGSVCLPKPGEEVCGDDWIAISQAQRCVVAVIDGLGHGSDANKAARVAVQSVEQNAAQAPGSVLENIHAASRGTRGSAAGVCAIDLHESVCVFAGIGNVACAHFSNGHLRHFVSHNGIAGHSVRKIAEFSAPWLDDSILVMHSDGLASQWDLASYPGLVARHAGTIAAVLYRDHVRGRDDVTVIVAKPPRAMP